MRSTDPLAPTLLRGQTLPLLLHFQELAQPLWQALWTCRLDRRRRKALGGNLFSGVFEFVAAVADGLGAAPELFARVSVRGAELLTEQDEALDLLILSQSLRELSELAYDVYLQKHSRAIQLAQAVMAWHRLSLRAPFRTDEERVACGGRRGQLSPAQKVLADRLRRRLRRTSFNYPRARG